MALNPMTTSGSESEPASLFAALALLLPLRLSCSSLLSRTLLLRGSIRPTGVPRELDLREKAEPGRCGQASARHW